MSRLRNMMYFGNKEHMDWVSAPDNNYDSSKIGWDGNVTQLLNGGAFVARSTSAHKEYQLSWNMKSRDQIRQIADYADGVYGDGAIYFLDPMAMDKNLLPQHWATPRLGLKDAPLLSGQLRDRVLEYLPGMPNAFGYPTQGVIYNSTFQSDPSLTPSIWCPIPPGYTAWFGAHGIGQGFLAVRPEGGTQVNVTPLPVTSAQRFNYSFDGDTYPSITIGMFGTGYITLSGMMLQVLPTGVTPSDGRFISGQGNGGVRFSGSPTRTQYSAALDKESLVAKFIEDELWR